MTERDWAMFMSGFETMATVLFLNFWYQSGDSYQLVVAGILLLAAIMFNAFGRGIKTAVQYDDTMKPQDSVK